MDIQSLRMRSLITIVAVVLPLMALYTALSYSHVSYNLGQRFDGRMRGELRMLEVAVEKSSGDVARLKELANLLPIDTFPQRRVFGVWFDGELVLATEKQPFESPPHVTDGFEDVEVGDERYRILSKSSPPTPQTASHSMILAVADHEPTRTALIRQAMWDVIIPLIIGAPLVVLGIYIALIRSLSPLTRLADEIRHRSPQQLKPIATADVPSEALPIANSVNQLMLRVGDSLERERRFTADAAHELKTPLTALKAHAQVALRTEDENIRRDTLRNIARTVNRTDRMIAQLLTLARLDPSTGQLNTERVDLAKTAVATLSDLKQTAEVRQQTLTLHADDRVIVNGNTDALAILIRNIVENALLYSHEQTPVEVFVRRQEGRGAIEIRDRGPGIPAEQKQEVFQRFRRIPGAKSPGTGLGLSIVQRIAELHHGEVTLNDGESGVGLSVVVSLPLAINA